MKQRTFLFIIVLLSTLTANAFDAIIDDIYYKFDASTQEAIVDGATYNTGSVTIPETVTYNGVTYSVTSIGNAAFLCCSGLTSVSIPNSVKSIKKNAFYGCSGLTSMTIPNSVTSIGERTFSGCSGLTSLTIGNSVMSIEDDAFLYCYKLTSVHITDIAAWCEINFSNYQSNPLFYAQHLFMDGKEITDLVIPNSVTVVREITFYNCSSLTSLTIPNSVESIGVKAFSGCSGLTTLTIGNSVASIGDSAFYQCTGLTSISVDKGNTVYDSRDNCNALINTATNTLIIGCMNTVIPNSVTCIGGSAFFKCSGLTSLTIPNSVMSIEDDAFSRCSGLTSVVIPNSVLSIGKYAFCFCI